MSIRISDTNHIVNNAKNELKAEQSSETLQSNSSSVRELNTIPSSLLRGAYGVLPQKKIDAIQNLEKPKSVSFSANPLYDINLKKLADNNLYEPLKAKFSQLLNNDDDAWEMLNVQDVWGRLGSSEYTEMITDNFIKAKNPQRAYYLVETSDSRKELFERATALLETTNPKKLDKDIFEIHFLQASPALVGKNAPEIKGSGELSLYGAVKVAKENGFKKVQLFSSNDGFYEKMGFVKAESLYPEDKTVSDGGIFELSADMFDDFLVKIENKYKIR